MIHWELGSRRGSEQKQKISKPWVTPNNPGRFPLIELKG